MNEQFDHEKLDVYQLEPTFLGWVAELLVEVRENTRRQGEIVDQLDRAGLSVLLNTADGNGKRQRRVRAKFFDDARGSTTGCAACLDALVAKNVCDNARIIDGKKTLLRIVSMLSKLVAPFEQADGFRGDEAEYRVMNQVRSRTRTGTRTTEW